MSGSLSSVLECVSFFCNHPILSLSSLYFLIIFFPYIHNFLFVSKALFQIDCQKMMGGEMKEESYPSLSTICSKHLQEIAADVPQIDMKAKR